MFSYFYGEESDMFTFYRIPKTLFTDKIYKDLSTDAKLLYGLMLDRMSLSRKNKWFDSENRVYIYFTIEDTMEYLNCGKNKAIKLMQELDIEKGKGLIYKKNQGLNKPNIIYVKNCHTIHNFKKLQFSYFYGEEADMFTFYRIPKNLFTDEIYKDLSTDAKLLYGLMLDRMSLSRKNKWCDNENRVYIYFTIEDTMEYFNCGNNKASKLINDLGTGQGLGLIDRKKQGFGKPCLIYVKNCCTMLNSEKTPLNKETSRHGKIKPPDMGKSNLQTWENQTSRRGKIKPQDMGKSNPNKTELNKTESSNIYLSRKLEKNLEQIHLVQEQKSMMDRKITKEKYKQIKENIHNQIEYDILLEREDKKIVDEIVDTMLGIRCELKESTFIGTEEKPTIFVQNMINKIDFEIVMYIIESLKSVTTKIKNMNKYLIKTLYTAPTTYNLHLQQKIKQQKHSENKKRAKYATYDIEEAEKRDMYRIPKI